MSDIFLIKKPWVTEKVTDLNKSGKYVFIVKPSATKNEVKKAVKEIYRVDAVNVNVINRRGKEKRFRNVYSEKSGYKKAIVTLRPGQKIDLGR
ncbi:MAG: 50S ribosomal protein L23 [Candidatus Liptonbacteria bacterium]|nr:50S ribosomal protein L23 [Candidatus Liptonbacteria bacterium]